MPKIEDSWRYGVNRRRAFRALAGFLAGSPLLRAQQDPFRDHSRVPGLDELRTVFDFEPVAFAKLPRQTYDYNAYGTEGEFTLRRNREAFEWVDLVPRSVVHVSSVSTATEVLGTKLSFPIMVAPTAGHGALHPEAEAASEAGCSAASETTLISSQGATVPIDKIAAAGKGPLWFQLYAQREPEKNWPVLEQALQAGCKAVVVTVDQQVPLFERAVHYRNLIPRGSGRAPRRRPTSGPGLYQLNENRLWYDWKFFDDIRRFVKAPVLVKGVVTAEDARLCVEYGFHGVYVSNHGGRSVDYEPSTLEVLPEIVDAVKGRIPVIVDGGFRRGSDILKALALGAAAVAIGRPQRWGLAAFGAAGVQRVLEILQTELIQAMAQTGRPTMASIDRTLVRTYFP